MKYLPVPSTSGATDDFIQSTDRKNDPLYMRQLLVRRNFTSLEEINRQSSEWCYKVAGMREHGAIRQQPLTRFCLAEMDELLACN